MAETVTTELPPLQAMAVDEDVADSAEGSVTVTEVMAMQPLASVTVKEYAPAARVKLPVPL